MTEQALHHLVPEPGRQLFPQRSFSATALEHHLRLSDNCSHRGESDLEGQDEVQEYVFLESSPGDLMELKTNRSLDK